MTKDEVLKLALEAMESVTVECNNFHHPKKDQNHHWAKCPPVARWDKAITAIKEALAQPEQEPVGEVVNATDKAFECRFVKILPIGTKFYTTPPQPKPLTDEQIDEEFKLYASKFDTSSDKWLDMGADDYFKAGFKAAHGIKE